MTTLTHATTLTRYPNHLDRRCVLAVIMLCVTILAACVSADGQAKPRRDGVQPRRYGLTASAAVPAFTCPLQPTGRNFVGQDLTNHNFHADQPGSLKGANFTNAILKGAIFAGQDLTGASFEGADLGPSDKGPVDFTNTWLEKSCFINAVMNETNFTFATIKCTDFSNTSLMQANFGPRQNILSGDGCRTRFNAATIDVTVITPENWSKIDFSNTNFQNLSPATFSLQGADISGAILVGTNFSNIDMTSANLTGVDFSYATLIKTKLDNAALNGSKLVNANLDYATMTCARFYGVKADNVDNPNGNLCPDTPDSATPNQAADLTLAVLQHADLTNATLNSAILSGANLSGAILKNASFINAVLEPHGTLAAASFLGADLTGANFTSAHINYVQFNNVFLTSATFDNITSLGVDFTGSIMPNASFDQATLEGVVFHSTILQAAKFTGTTMKTTPNSGGSGVSFTCAQLGGANFKDATITAADFQAAVLPPANACCPQKVGDSWCGTIDITQQAYGTVIFPVLNSAINCPNGDVAQCSGKQWQIPNWQTNLCSPDHTTRVVWTAPDCGTTPGDIVHFKDDNLQQCILEALPGKPMEVTVSTAAQIPQIDCAGRGITDLSGLEKFTHLTSLDLTANQLTQFAFDFPALETLKIADNQLTLLDLSKLPSLIRLDATNNQLQSVAGLATVYLQVLDLSHNQLTAFDLPTQDSLLYADLSYNKLITVLDEHNQDLRRQSSLSYLDLSYNSLTTLGSLQSIANSDTNPNGALESLFLTCNPTFDCNSLTLDGTYPALQKSQCADFNTQSNQWIIRQHPLCQSAP